nr:gamma-aminobutyric acid type B receptor subunit 1-like [Lytechinus pictus]
MMFSSKSGMIALLFLVTMTSGMTTNSQTTNETTTPSWITPELPTSITTSSWNKTPNEEISMTTTSTPSSFTTEDTTWYRSTSPSSESTPMTSAENTLSSSLSTPSSVDGKRILNILGLFPMTISLGEEVRGESSKLSAEIALEHINENENILPEYELRLHSLDTMCHPGVGTRLLFEEVNSNTTYIMLLGSGCSEVAKTVSLAADLWNIVQVSYSASSPALSNREAYMSFFRTNVADSLYNYARLAIIKHYGWQRVATLHENQEAYSTAVNLFSELLAANGINLTTSESFTVEPGEQIDNLKEKGAWIIFGNFQEVMARKVFCEAYKKKLYGKNYAWFLLGKYSPRWWEKEDNSTTCTPEQIYTALDGYILTDSVPMNLYPDRPTISGHTSAEIAEVFRNRAEQAGFDDVAVTSYASDAYDAMWSIALTLERASSDHDLTIVSGELHEFSYERHGTREHFINTLSTLQFEGFSGSVSFTDAGDREGLIEIRQIRDGEEIVVGLYSFHGDEQHGTDLNITDIQWSGGRPPKDETTEEIVFQTIPLLYLYVAGGLCATGIVFASVCLLSTIILWERSAFYRASPLFLVLGLLGCVGMYVSIFLMGVGSDVIGPDYQVIICTVRSWTLALSFSLAYGALFAKIYRAHKLLVSKANLWNPGGHFPFMFRSLMSIFLFCVIVLIVWTVWFPIQRDVVSSGNEYNEDTNTLYRFEVEYCLRGNALYFTGTIMGFLGLALLLGAFLSYETRAMKIVTLNDTFVSGIAVYCSVTFSVISTPLAFILGNNPQIGYLTVASMAWIGVTLVLIIIYAPKFHAVRGTWAQRQNSQTRTIQEIYDEEVDEETKLRHKIDEVDRDIEEFKKEITRRKEFGRQSLLRGFGIWCFGHSLRLSCGHRKIKVPSLHTQMRKPTMTEYDNHALEASDWNLARYGTHEPGSSSSGEGSSGNQQENSDRATEATNKVNSQSDLTKL